MHFFEGFRISHEVSKINIIDMDTVKPLIDDAKLQRHRYRGMNPNHPNQRGTAQVRKAPPSPQGTLLLRFTLTLPASAFFSPPAVLLPASPQGPEVFFQAVEAANTYYDACAGIVEETFEQVAQLTGRHYK